MSLGNNIFNNQNGFAVNYNNGFQLIIEDKLIVYNETEEKITGVFDIIDDIHLSQNILNDIDTINLEKYQNKIQAFIQTYNNRMINNTMSLEN